MGVELWAREIRNASWSVLEEGSVLSVTSLLDRFRRSRPSEPAGAADKSDTPQVEAADKSDRSDVADAPAAPSRTRKIAGHVLTVSAFVLIFAALILPNVVSRLERPGTYLRLPVEGFVAIGLLLLVPGGRAKRIVAGVLGAGLGVLTVMKITDMGFYKTLARPFDPVLDWVLLDDAESFLKDSIGQAGAIAAAVALVLLIVAILALMTLAAMRVAKVGVRHRRTTALTAVSGTAVWVVLLLLGVQGLNNFPIAARSGYTYAWDRAHMVKKGLADERSFAREVQVDAYANTPADQLLTSLKGKDVMVTFVESYGRSAVQDPTLNTGVVPVLDKGTAELAAAGYSAKSGWLTSPTFGGGSWLAHSTLLSGLWINNQQRYRNLTSSDRLTLTSLFRKANWDTMSVMPGATRAWPEGNFYGYNRVFDSRNTGYAGPNFSWQPQPDQYTLSWFEKNVHSPAHQPYFVEMPLVSSHTPWAPLPSFIDWDQVGDGSIYERLQRDGKSPKSVWADPAKVRHEYARSIQYTLTTVFSWLEKYGDDNTVMVLLGDHQPSPLVVGDGASHDVPITILAKDKTVLDKIADWNWTDGTRPAPAAPVWPMNEFRDKFLAAYGPDAGLSHAIAPPR